MSFEFEKNTLNSHFATSWANANWGSTSPPDIAYNKVTYDPGQKVEWVRISVLNAESAQISLGTNPYFRYWGMVVIQIFTKPGSGYLRSTKLTDIVTSIFRAQNISGIHCQVPVVHDMGIVFGWDQVNVMCPFFREEQ